MEMSESDYNKIYKLQLENSLEFQDYICFKLCTVGIIIQNIGSKKYQRYMENLLGLEIKNDKIFRETNRLYIETHEKSHPLNEFYILSGIYRNDNCWLFGIGDEKDFWIFSKKTLIRLHKEKPDWLFIPNSTPTSKGFCIPLEYANEYAELHFEW